MICLLERQSDPSRWGPKTIKNIYKKIRKKDPNLKQRRLNHFSTKVKLTLTTEAPVANFLPSFFEASLSLTPEMI